MIDERAHSSAPREAIWRLVADIETWSSWGRWRTTERMREGVPAPDGVHAVRRLHMGGALPPTIEEVTAFEAPARLRYELRSGLPLRAYAAEVTLADGAGGGTDIRWRTEFDPAIPGTGGFYRRFLGRFIADAANRLARAAER